MTINPENVLHNLHSHRLQPQLSAFYRNVDSSDSGFFRCNYRFHGGVIRCRPSSVVDRKNDNALSHPSFAKAVSQNPKSSHLIRFDWMLFTESFRELVASDAYYYGFTYLESVLQ